MIKQPRLFFGALHAQAVVVDDAAGGTFVAEGLEAAADEFAVRVGALKFIIAVADDEPAAGLGDAAHLM